jgi:pimeloyl-ACP methyl ester carboxylesterase
MRLSKMQHFLKKKWIAVGLGCLVLLFAIRFLMWRVSPKVFPKSKTAVTLSLSSGPFECRYYEAKEPINGIVVLGTGDGGWSYWEENTAKSLSRHGYYVIGWDCRKFADSRKFDHEGIVEGFNAAVSAAYDHVSRTDLPVWYSGWSTGAEQSVAAAASRQRTPNLKGLLLVAPGSRGRFGLQTSDFLGVVPTGPGSFALADFANELEHIRVAQIAADLDPLDSSDWLTELKVPHKLFEMTNTLHDMGGAGPEFQKVLLNAIEWTKH